MTTLNEILHALPHQDPCFEPWIDEGPGYEPFRAIAEELKPRSVLEIGTLLGYSLVAMAHGSPRLSILRSVDSECYLPRSNQLAWSNLQYYFEEVRSTRFWSLLQWKSTWAMIRRRQSDLPVDLVHIDGDHSTLGKLRDLIVVHELVRPRWILIDDTRKDEVWKAVDTFLYGAGEYRTYEFRLIEPARGLVLLTRREP